MGLTRILTTPIASLRAAPACLAALLTAHATARQAPPANTPLPEVTLTADDTKISTSTRIIIPPNTLIPDANNNGVLHITADNITIEFAQGSALRGAPAPNAVGAGGTPWNQLTGTGIRINGHKNVTIRNARVHGYKVGLFASVAHALTIDAGDFSDNFRQKLGSTPAAEDSNDWLWPHKNDANEWLTNYGSAIYLEDLDDATIKNVRIRRGQNGIILDRVNRARVFDNDASFLSGWGLALWRSSDNIITRNAFDFCVRGYSHTVYNRGQDSAGILAFEQSSRNLIAENSATHSGDGFFGFAGHEAIGENWWREQRDEVKKHIRDDDLQVLRAKLAELNIDSIANDWLDAAKRSDDQAIDAGLTLRQTPEVLAAFKRLGCNDNTLIANDFSYAPAHGIEMTFSHGNTYARNRLVGNAITGIWGGYSSNSLIIANEFADNGDGAYRLERGGVNIEHGSDNLIIDNAFRDNAAGIYLWWDNDAALLRMPGVRANYRGVSNNVIAQNRFERNKVNIHLRDAGPALKPGEKPRVDNTLVLNNRVFDGGDSFEPLTLLPVTTGQVPDAKIPTYSALGETKPVNARRELRGRQNIIMGQWGPWDHESPMIRRIQDQARGSEHIFEVFAAPGVKAEAISPGTQVRVIGSTDAPGKPARIIISSDEGSVNAYRVRVSAKGWDQEISGMIIAAVWNLRTFSWTPESDPRTNIEAWRARAADPGTGFVATVPGIDFRFGHFGPREQKWSDEISQFGPRGERFGVIATTSITLPKGKWKFRTNSDDGVRVAVDGTDIIKNWTWHAPTVDEAVFDQPETKPVTILLEYFEIDGFAVLEFNLEPIPE